MKTVRAGLAAFAAAVIFCCQSGAGAAPGDAAPPQKPDKQTAQPAGKPQTAAKPKAQTPPKQSAAPSGKSVCVAPAIGHKFHVQRIGLMVFGNSLDPVAVDSWGIDDAAVRKIQEILGKQFAVRRVTIPQAALAAYETPGGGLFRNPYDELMTALRAAGPTWGKCDFYVTLTRTASNYNQTNQSVAGLGILDHNSGLLQRLWLYASFHIGIYDGNFTLLKQTVPSTAPFLAQLMGPGLRCMYREVDSSWWPTPAQAAAQNAQLKSATRALVEQGLAKALPEMFEGS